MRSLNRVMLIGNLGKDPEIQNLESGVTLAKFSIATSESYKDKSGNTVDQTEWHNIVLWRKLAEIAAEYLKKGSRIYLEGKIRTRSWDDQDGNKKYITEIIGDNFFMLDRKGDFEGGSSASGERSTPSVRVSEPVASGPDDGTIDDLPF